MFLFSRFFRFDVYTYAGHRKKTASSSYCDSPCFFIVFCYILNSSSTEAFAVLMYPGIFSFSTFRYISAFSSKET